MGYTCDVFLAEPNTSDQCEEADMMSEDDFGRLSIYHVPDRPCPPFVFDRIRHTLPSNMTLLPSTAEPNVSLLFSFELPPIIEMVALNR